MKKLCAVLTGFILPLLCSFPLFAQDTASDNPGLADRVGRLEDETRQLRSNSQTEQVGSQDQGAETKTELWTPDPNAASGVQQTSMSASCTNFSYGSGKSEYPTGRLTGFFQTDAGWINQDLLSRQTLGDIQDGWDFRRARLAGSGKVAEDVSYLMEFDFAQLQPWFVDVWMEFHNVGNVMNLRIGRFRQPFGMSELNSIRGLPFLERPLLFALSPFRQTGVMAYGNDDEDNSNLTWAASAYRYLSDNFGNVYGDQGGWGFATRLTTLPIYDDDGDRLVHIGFDYSYNDPGRDVVQYINVPEFVLGQNPLLGPAGLDKRPFDVLTPFVNTGAFAADQTHIFNAEAAAGIGNFYAQTEVRWAIADRQNGNPTETFPGAYAHFRYVITGEKLPYQRASGLFGRIVPRHPVKFGGGGGIGAWEAAARWSWLDLDGTNLPGPGRELTNLTLGLNWYLNRYTKFQFNYIHANLTDRQLGESNAGIFGVRGQIDF